MLQTATEGNNATEVFEPDDDGYLNYGKTSNTTEWPWEDVQLPILDYNTKLQFHTKFDVTSGGANLDNIFSSDA